MSAGKIPAELRGRSSVLAARRQALRMVDARDAEVRRFYFVAMREAVASAHSDAAEVAEVTGEDVAAILERWDVSVFAEMAT